MILSTFNIIYYKIAMSTYLTTTTGNITDGRIIGGHIEVTKNTIQYIELLYKIMGYDITYEQFLKMSDSEKKGTIQGYKN